jgi:hypothetical protein
MDPRESDPTGAFTSGGGAGLEDEAAPDSARPVNAARATAPGVDEAERRTITSATAATSEVADRDTQDEAEGDRDGPPLPR